MDRQKNDMGWEYTVPPSPRQAQEHEVLKAALEREASDRRRAAAKADRKRRRHG